MLIQNKPNIVWYEAYITLFMYVFLAFTDKLNYVALAAFVTCSFNFAIFV